MIQVYKLTKRHVDKKGDLPTKYQQILTFSTCIGHGVGTIDFSQKIYEISEEEYIKMLENCDEYTKFKLGNVNRYFEIEIFPEHAARIIKTLPKGEFYDILSSLHEGYLVVRKDFE